jgi:hypothetical protein
LPIKLGGKKYKNWKAGAKSLQNKGYSKESANAIIASIENKKKAKHSKKK